MAEAEAAPASQSGSENLVQFSIDRIYVKDLSLENPGAPQSFQLTDAPTVEIGLRTGNTRIAPDVYEFVLTMTVTAKIGDKTLFLVEVAQAGIFTIKGVPQDHLQPVIMIHCPTVLFPYVRETIADATNRAGYPPVHLAPINFEMLYQQQIAQMQQGQPAPASVN
ncbi:MAG TPA: protein-export chaperone SecB [Casimicrobiaceae bacterium]|nr:protein-export chaperone SecB [Casimicrobiaceae bacterium]